jgi:hypothetical protein
MCHFFWPPSLPSAVEDVSFFYKRLFSSNPRVLSDVNGNDSIITFNISETPTTEDEGFVVCFDMSCVFVFSEDFSASFHFLGADTFSSGTFYLL